MAHSITQATKGYVAQAQQLTQQIGRVHPLARQLDGLEAEIDAYARNSLSSLPPSQVPEAAKQDIQISQETLQKCKAALLSSDWLETPLFYGCGNIASPGHAAVLSVDNGCYPRWCDVGYYNCSSGIYQKSFVQGMRLHPAQHDNLPQSVKDAIGDPKGKKVEYLLAMAPYASIKQTMKEQNKPFIFNLSTHHWAHHHYQKGQDRTEMVNMGIFEGQNVYPVNTPDGIPFNSMKPIPVICHPKDGRKALSPNNAHFGVDANAPFSTFWSVCKLGDRVIATKHIMINDFDFVTEPFAASFRGKSSNLNQIFKQVNENPFVQTLAKLAEAFEQNRSDAQQLFDQLSLPPRGSERNACHHQNEIYRQAWLDLWDKNHPGQPAPHGDFGRAAFHCYSNLDPRYHCNGAKKAEIIRNYCARLGQSYFRMTSDLQALFAPPRWIAPATELEKDKIRQLLPIADAFKREDGSEGMRLFNALDISRFNHKSGVYSYVWEMADCPMDFPGDFGAAAFHGDSRLDIKRDFTNEQKANAILNYIYSI